VLLLLLSLLRGGCQFGQVTEWIHTTRAKQFIAACEAECKNDRYERAVQSILQALAIQQGLHEANDRAVLKDRVLLAEIQYRSGRYAGSMRSYKVVLESADKKMTRAFLLAVPADFC